MACLSPLIKISMPGRIPQAFIDDLLERLDIVEVIDKRVKLRKTGKNYSALCPFHEEKTPSFSVNADKQFYYCFGCGATGNAIGFVMEYENLDFPRAVESLASSVGLQVPREPRAGDAQRDAQEQTNKALYAMMDESAKFYGVQLRRHPEAQRAINYLKSRGLTGEVAKQFNLGFAPPGWHSLQEALGTDEAQQSVLKDCGMLVENDAGRVYDRFRDRVVFPIRDQRGRVVAFGGRVLGDDKPKYLNSPETDIFHKGRELYGLYEAKAANRKLSHLIVVEGYMDVIALAQHGINNAIATLGTATSQTHVQRIFRLCPEVVYCFDGDSAGRQAAQRAMESTLPCMEDGRQARFLFLPEGEDPDTLIRKLGAEHFSGLVANALPLEEFLFEAVGEGLDTDRAEGKARLSKLALPYLQQLPVGIYRQLMFQALAKRTGVAVDSLMQLLPEPAPARLPEELDHSVDQQVPATAPGPGPGPGPGLSNLSPDVGAIGSEYASLAEAAITLLLHQPEIAKLADPAVLAELDGREMVLLRELLSLLERRPESNTAMLLGHWYGTPEGQLLNRLAEQERLIPSAGIEQEFSDILSALARAPQQSRLAEQVDKLKDTNYADVSELEKQRLRELLREKLRRDAGRIKPD
ncbi:MAG: DNA primase [Pseudomonadota bacterium]